MARLCLLAGLALCLVAANAQQQQSAEPPMEQQQQEQQPGQVQYATGKLCCHLQPRTGPSKGVQCPPTKWWWVLIGFVLAWKLSIEKFDQPVDCLLVRRTTASGMPANGTVGTHGHLLW
jgi:hypothetical protein